MRTSSHYQPEAQHPNSSAIHKLPADYPIFWRATPVQGTRTERNSGDFTIYQALASLRGRSFQGWDRSKRSCGGAIVIAVKR